VAVSSWESFAIVWRYVDTIWGQRYGSDENPPGEAFQGNTYAVAP
jgi:hypothetical protein